MNNILELDNVSKQFKGSDFALKNISFALPYGTIMGYVGENGAGKTTTIGCILNTLCKDSGQIRLFGKEMDDGDTDLREDIGVIFDGDNFPEYLNAEKLSHVMSGLYNSWDRDYFYQQLQHFSLNKKQKIKTYSKGMKMKLAIAAALSHHPKLLILDEATSGLDPVMREEILEVLMDFVQDDNHSILLSSHITSDLEKIADYITFIHNGKIILTARKDELIYQYGVMRCKRKDFSAIAPEDIISYRKKDYQIDILIKNKKELAHKYKNIVIDNVSIDEITLLLVKGEQL